MGGAVGVPLAVDVPQTRCGRQGHTGVERSAPLALGAPKLGRAAHTMPDAACRCQLQKWRLPHRLGPLTMREIRPAFYRNAGMTSCTNSRIEVITWA